MRGLRHPRRLVASALAVAVLAALPESLDGQSVDSSVTILVQGDIEAAARPATNAIRIVPSPKNAVRPDVRERGAAATERWVIPPIGKSNQPAKSQIRIAAPAPHGPTGPVGPAQHSLIGKQSGVGKSPLVAIRILEPSGVVAAASAPAKLAAAPTRPAVIPEPHADLSVVHASPVQEIATVVPFLGAPTATSSSWKSPPTTAAAVVSTRPAIEHTAAAPAGALATLPQEPLRLPEPATRPAASPATSPPQVDQSQPVPQLVRLPPVDEATGDWVLATPLSNPAAAPVTTTASTPVTPVKVNAAAPTDASAAAAVAVQREGLPPKEPSDKKIAEAVEKPAGAPEAPEFAGSVSAPADAANDESQWNLSLIEAIRLGIANSKDVAVLGYSPRILETSIAQECSYFDPVVGVTGYGGQQKAQVRSLVQSQGANVAAQRTDLFGPLLQPNQMYTRQQLYTGGDLTYGFGTLYSNYSPPGDFLLINPGWNSNVNVRYRQPLGRGRGYDITVTPLRIAKSNVEQSRHEFAVQVRETVLNIELAFWTLSGARREVQLVERYRDAADKTARDEAEREKLGKSSLPNVLIARSQAETFDIHVTQSRRDEAVAADSLRQVMGLRVAGNAGPGFDLLPDDVANKELAPTVRPEDIDVDLDWRIAVQTSLSRPEISAQRSAVHTASLAVYHARNGLLPNVSMQADYAVTGLEDRLDKSIGTIGRHEFNAWGVGVFYERPLGMRSSNAALKQALLRQARENAVLRRLEHNIVHRLRQSYETVRSANVAWLQQQQRVEIMKQQWDAYAELYLQGRVELFRLLDIERGVAAAELESNIAWTAARLAEARWRFEKFEDTEAYCLDLAP